MTAERSFIYQGSESHTPEAFAKDIGAAHRWRWPLHKLFGVARAVWALPLDKFGWEAGRLMREAPKGYCSTCGVGFQAYIECGSEPACNFVVDGGGNPSPVWPPGFAGVGGNLGPRWTAPDPAPAAGEAPVKLTGSIGPAW